MWPSYYPVVDELSNNAVDDGWAPHLRIGGFALLLTLAAGFAILVGWIWLGGFGIVLGIVAAVAGMSWLRRRYGAVFPEEVSGSALLRLLAAVVVLGGIAVLLNNS